MGMKMFVCRITKGICVLKTIMADKRRDSKICVVHAGQLNEGVKKGKEKRTRCIVVIVQECIN